MKSIIGFFLFGLALVVGHFFTLQMAPSVIMTKAISAMGDRGIPVHKFVLSKRVTPETQSIIRSSPDLAYSICLFDLSNGPVLVRGTRWDGYASLTIFDSVTDAVYIISLDTTDGGSSGSVLLTTDSELQPKDHPTATLKKPKGIALIRRLAPTPALYEKAKALSASDSCDVLSNS